MTTTGRTFTFPVRPLRRETTASYTRRILEANHEHPSSRPDSIEHLAHKTGRSLDNLVPPPAGYITHSDGSQCGQCHEQTPSRALCTRCSRGAHVEQHPHLDEPICIRHRRWIGYGATSMAQTPVGPAHIAAARSLDRLRRAGRYEHRVFLLILRCLAPRPEVEPAMFVLAVQILRAVTARDFLSRLLDPALPYAAALQVLIARIAQITNAPAVADHLWVALRSVFAHLHAHRHDRLSVPAPWAHAFPVPADLLDAASRRQREFDPFPEYLTAASIPLADAIKIEVANKLLEHDAGNARRLRTLCANGHRIVVFPSGKPVIGCQVCRTGLRPGVNDLRTLAPKLAAEWDADANAGLTAELIPAGSSPKYWWRCANGHSFEATPNNRYANKTACPVCMNRLIIVGVNDLATTHPDIALELQGHPELPTITASTEKQMVFTCAKGHRFARRVIDRVEGKGCPDCTRRILVRAGRSLVDTHPELVPEWHPKLNRFRPEHYSHGSKEEVWWMCLAGHEFKQRIERRTRAGYRCGICSKRQRVVGINDLATTDPELTSEWHSYENWKKPTEVTAIDQLFWWTCLANGHHYKQSVDHRRKSKGCPQCPFEERILAGR